MTFFYFKIQLETGAWKRGSRCELHFQFFSGESDMVLSEAFSVTHSRLQGIKFVFP